MSDDEIVLSPTGSHADDSNSPFFLHHSDHPGLILISKRLNGDNYHSWCRAMRISLSAKNKTGFITDKIKEPNATSKPDEHALWRRCNDMVLSWILNSIEPELADSVLSCNTPHAIWEDLRERLSLGNAPRIYQIQRDIYKIEQGSMSIAVYYTKLKGLWDELASFNSSVTCNCRAQNDRTKLMQFLMGLNESYSGTRGQILLMNPSPSVRQAYASVAQEEKQRELASSITMPSNTAAMIVRGNNNNMRPRANNQGNRNNEPFECTYCGQKFHRESTCWKKNGYPPGHPKHKPRHQHQGNNNNSNSKSISSANFVDSSASNSVPTFQELQNTLPDLTEEQYVQVIAALSPKATVPQANATSASVSEFSKGLGYEDDDWCG
uniref:uncharacterized protein LOC105352268 n=1 Tax=Fragaria vesca subsp. vesca TaxID=101020 RepID=UPI0005CB0234|nr:PREDICTED: uncharacterized protein LOC105352268 [Fragaria vesca subsp. vesca]